MAERMEENDKKDVVEVDLTEEERKSLGAADDHHEDDEDHEEEDDTADQRTARSDEAGEDREAIRERRRKEKQERKERREKAIARDKLELDFLRKRNDDLERRVSAQEVRAQRTELASIDAQIQRAAGEAQMAERVIAKAIEAHNGEDAAQAMRYRDEAIAKVNALNAQKARQQAEAKRQTTQQSNVLDDRVAAHAKEFVEENSWYDPQGRDEDSAIVLAIDSAMVKDGYDPKTQEYWEELRKRVARRLPERVNQKSKGQDDTRESEQRRREARGGPALGSGKEHAPASTRREVYISPERKQALIEAGVWDDPVLRQKYVKRYMEYDRNNRA